MFRRRKLLSLVLSIAILLAGLNISVFANNQNTASGSFQFPNTASNEWKQLVNHEDKVEVCQIPTTILTKMSTDELLDTILKYPLLIEIYAYNDEQTGFDAVLKNFNGLQELLKRDDAGKKLFAKYKQMTVFKDLKSVNTSALFDLAYVEILLRQDAIASQFDAEDNKALEKEIENKYIEKKAHPDIYGITAATSYRVLDEKQASSSLTTQTTGTVYTPNGSAVSVFNYTPELTSAEKTSASNSVKTAYPNVTIVSEATRNYNCHSYAWYSQSTSTNKWWMNYPTAYMTDGSYTNRSSNSTSISVGDKIYYSYPGQEHSGIVSGLGRVGYNTYVTSKWGELPLVYHFYTDCPYWQGSNYYVSYYYR